MSTKCNSRRFSSAVLGFRVTLYDVVKVKTHDIIEAGSSLLYQQCNDILGQIWYVYKDSIWPESSRGVGSNKPGPLGPSAKSTEDEASVTPLPRYLCLGGFGVAQ